MSDRPPSAGMETEVKCAVCDKEPSFRWTDTHGVGACVRCGCPYKLYHYEGNQRVEKPPKCLLIEEWVSLTRRYWQETGRNCDPGAFNIPGSSYEVASREDFYQYRAWMNAHSSEWPQDTLTKEGE